MASNLEHSFRRILKQLDPQTQAADFSAIYASLLRENNPYLQSPPPDSLATLDLLRLIRNTIHNSWVHDPDSGQNREIPFKGVTYSFIVGKKLDFISWDLLTAIAEDIFRIALAVVKDPGVIALSAMSDPGAGDPLD